jgi:UDP-3-O-[3-hydroxymyristoyl] glucosamine N-acyltransferase
MTGGQVGFAGHITIADNTHVGAQAGITNNIKTSGQTILGSPAWDAKGYMKSAAIFRRLPEMYKEISELKKEIQELKSQQK